MNHQGKKLREYIDNWDLSYSQISRRLKHGSKNTLLSWFKRETLNMRMFEQLSTIFPDIMDSFPEVGWKPKTSLKADENVEKRFDELQKAHTELLIRFADLSQKYIELLEKK